MAYLVSNVNSFKNKEVEEIVLAKNLKELLSIKNPYEINLNSMVDSTISDMLSNANYYKSDLSKINIDEINKNYNIFNEKETKLLSEHIKNNDLNSFFTDFKKIFIKKSKDPLSKTYDLVGCYTDIINKASTRRFINFEYMNQMVESINNIDGKSFNQDPNEYIRNKVVELRKVIESDSLGDYEYLNKSKLADFYKKIVSPEYEDATISEKASMLRSVVDSLNLNNKLDITKDLVNDGIAINSTSFSKDIYKFLSINKLKTELSDLVDLNSFDLEDVKSAIQLFYLKDDSLINFVSKNDILNKFKDNKLIQHLIDSGMINKLSLDKKDIEKIFIVREATNLNSLVKELSGTTLNVNVTKLFYDKFSKDFKSEEAQKDVERLYSKFSKLKEASSSNKNNILILIALDCFDPNVGKYDKSKEAKLLELLEKPLSSYTNEDYEVIDKISDKWLKWSISHNRELRESGVYLSDIRPENFDFVYNQRTVKQLGIKDLNPYDVEIINASKIFSINFNEIDIKDLYPKNEIEEDIMKRFSSLKEFSMVNTKVKITNKADLFSSMNLYVELNKNEKILESVKNGDIKSELLFNFDNVAIKNVLNKLSQYSQPEIKAINIMLENTKVIPNYSTKSNSSRNNPLYLENYIKSYAKYMEKDSYKIYKPENSEIPLVSSKLNKNWEIKTLNVLNFETVLNGEIANHCMSYEGASWGMINYMFNNPNRVVITQLEKDGRGISNAYTWTKDDTICFDSIEVVTKSKDYENFIINGYKEMAMKLILNNDKSNRVVMGYSSHNNNSAYSFEKMAIPHHYSSHEFITIGRNEMSYTDSGSQQNIIMTLNEKDLSNSILSKHVTKSLLNYSQTNNCNKQLLKDFSEKLKNKFEDMKKNLPNVSFIDDRLNDIVEVERTISDNTKKERER